MKQGGRTVVVFVGLTLIVFVCGIAISLYLLSQEHQTRLQTEASLAEVQDRNMKIESSLKEAQQQVDLLKGKNKDSDEKINSLMEELDLDKALREQVKEENRKLKETLEAESKAKVEVHERLTAELQMAQAALKEADVKIAAHVDQLSVLQKEMAEFQAKNSELTQKLSDFESGKPFGNDAFSTSGQSKVNLDRIVITPESAQEGRVLNVDTETEFLIFDLGAKHGIKMGDVMSVYRSKTYLGDVKVSRVQEEMSAADLIPPFSSRKVRKSDQVVPKR